MKCKLAVAVVAVLLTVFSQRCPAQEADKGDSGKSCSSSCCCCAPLCFAYGELLYLQPRNAEVVYATPMDGPIAPGAVPLQVGRMGMVDPDYEPGFRVGLGHYLTSCSSLAASYTHYENGSADQLLGTDISPTTVVRSMVLHPSSANAATDFSAAAATLDINLDLVDLDYRRIFTCSEAHVANYLIGIRYGRLEQDFAAAFVDGGTETVQTDLSFDGAGIRLGLECERHAKCGLMVYARGYASFLAGQVRGQYFQGGTFDPVVVDTYWKAGRVITVLDLELGLGWVSHNRRWTMQAGYLMSSWLNTINSDDLITAVQANQFGNLANAATFGSGMTFDGLTARIEYCW